MKKAILLFSISLGMIFTAKSQDTLTVTIADDVVNPGDNKLSIREAVDSANTTSGKEVIRFDNTVFQKSDTLFLTHDLDLTSASGVVISGEGAHVNISGSQISSSHSDTLNAFKLDSGQNELRNLNLVHFKGDAILIDSLNSGSNVLGPDLNIHHSGGSGIQVVGTSENEIKSNKLWANSEHGISIRHSSRITIKKNILATNMKSGLSIKKGGGEHQINENWVFGNHKNGLKLFVPGESNSSIHANTIGDSLDSKFRRLKTQTVTTQAITGDYANGNHGIALYGIKNVEIWDNIIKNSKQHGIFVSDTLTVNQSNDTTYHFPEAVELYQNKLSRNYFAGIGFSNVKALSILNNRITFNGAGIYGSGITYNLNKLNMDSTDRGTYDISNNFIENTLETGPVDDGINIQDLHEAVISSNKILRSDDEAIQVDYGNKIEVSNNRITETDDHGIELSHIYNSFVNNNKLTNLDDDAVIVSGMYNSFKEKAIIESNSINASDDDGINLSNVDTTKVIKNDVRNTDDNGIEVDGRDSLSQTLVNNNTINHVDDDGIDISRITSIVIKDNEISTAEDNGINVYSGGSVLIMENEVKKLDDEGIEVSTVDTSNIKNNKILESLSNSIDLNDNKIVSIKHNEILHAEDDGLEVSGGVEIEVIGNSISRSQDHLIDVYNYQRGYIRDNNVLSSQDQALEIDNTDSLWITDNTFRNSVDELIRLDNSNYIRVANNNLNGSLEEALFLNSAGYAELINNTSTNNNKQGFDLDNVDTVYIRKNKIIKSGKAGIDLNSYNQAYIDSNHIAVNKNGLRITSKSSNLDVVEYNNFVGNSKFGIVDTDTSTVMKAENNFWGHPAGPLVGDTLYDETAGGDRVTHSVDYEPFSSNYIFEPSIKPQITGIDPSGDKTEGGRKALINGFHFMPEPDIYFGKIEVDSDSINFVSSEFIEVKVPETSQRGYVPVIVKNDNGMADTLSRTFFYDAPPTVPNLISPISKQVLTPGGRLIWSVAEDNNRDSLRYQLQIDTVQSFTSPLVEQDSIGMQVKAKKVKPSSIFADTAFVFPLNDLETADQLTNNQTYYWRIRALDHHGVASDWSNNSSFFYDKDNTMPEAVESGFNPADSVTITRQYTKISWNASSDPDPDDTADSLWYRIRVIQANGDGVDYTIDTEPGITSQKIDTLEDNRIYSYQIKTFDSKGASSEWSATQYFIVNTKTEKPTHFTLINPTNDKKGAQTDQSFKWHSSSDKDPADTVRYYFYLSTDQHFSSLISRDSIGTDTSFTYPDRLENDKRYYWRVEAVDSFNRVTSSDTARFVVGTPSAKVGKSGDIPDEYALQQNYPNPFNPSTQIRYSIPQATEVTLEVYSTLGQRVEVLVDKKQSAGTYQVTFEAGNLSSGNYIYRLKAGEFEDIGQMMFVK